MPTPEDARFERLVGLIHQVKASLPEGSVRPEARIVDDLGLDSLDVLQLARKIVREISPDFDLEQWYETATDHGRTVQSLLIACDDASSETAGAGGAGDVEAKSGSSR